MTTTPETKSGPRDLRVGAFTWATTSGDATEVPFGHVVATGNGFAIAETVIGVSTRTDHLWTSRDGITWDRASLPVDAALPLLVSNDNGLWLTSNIEQERVWRSDDGEAWQEVDTAAIQGVRPTIQPYLGLNDQPLIDFSDHNIRDTFVSNSDVVVGQWGNGLVVSDRGAPFELVPAPWPSLEFPAVVEIVSSGGRFLAYVAGENLPEKAALWVSDDGLTWAEVGPFPFHRDPSDHEAGAHGFEVVERDGVFLAQVGYFCGVGTLWRSTDGIDWQLIGDSPDRGVACGATLQAADFGWVFVTDGGTSIPEPNVWVSTDGTAWEELDVGTLAIKGGDGSSPRGQLGVSVVGETIFIQALAHDDRSLWLGRPAVVGGGDWPAYGFDYANSVHNRDETVLSTDNVAGLVEVWRIDAGGVTGTPVVTGGVVYFADWHGAVHAVDAADGATIWRSQVVDVPISASVAVTDRLVIAGDLTGDLHAVDRDSGALVWSVPVVPHEAGLFSSPVVIDDIAVIATTSPVLGLEPINSDYRAAIVAFDVETGNERWRLNTDPDEDESGTWVAVWSSAAYDEQRGLIFIGTGNTNRAEPGATGINDRSGRSPTDLPWSDGVLAIHHDTGEVAWFYQVIEEDRQRDFDVGASPNLFTIGARDVVGVGGKSGDYVVLDRDTGELIWQTRLTEGSDIGGVMSTAAVGDGVIYVTSNDGGPFNGAIFALDTDDGATLWSQSFDGAIIGGSMTLANGVLYRGIWSVSMFGTSNSATAVALDAADGTILWTSPEETAFGGGFSIADGTLYAGFGSGLPPNVSTADGGLIAYRLP